MRIIDKLTGRGPRDTLTLPRILKRTKEGRLKWKRIDLDDFDRAYETVVCPGLQASLAVDLKAGHTVRSGRLMLHTKNVDILFASGGEIIPLFGMVMKNEEQAKEGKDGISTSQQ